MSLIKIPFLLAMTTCVHLAMNPPNKATKQEHYVPKNVNWKTAEFALSIVFMMFPVINVIYWVLTVSECAAILASAYPTFSLSQLALSILTFSSTTPFSLSTHVTQPTPTFFFSCLVGIFGCIVRLMCYREMGKMFTFELAQREDHKLITTGPYAVVRHPSYVGSVCAFSGSAVCLLGANSFFRESGMGGTIAGMVMAGFWLSGMGALSVILVAIRVREEDVMLRSTFGPVWDKWAEEVRYRMIPGVY